jgi:hypothetical protein
MQFSLPEKSINLDFDQIYKKTTMPNYYRWISFEIYFIVSLFGNMDVNIVFYKLDQT